ncbi:hypothetical protein WJX72_004851 [[Myrmecia] bisecta]|uniref:Sialidase domain-containing protein n=1 Tax=[Myrmecia] bisecta TaxID=41462 RepID=A0AAW1QR35_9CHLO
MENDFLLQQAKLLLAALVAYVLFNALDESHQSMLPALLSGLQTDTASVLSSAAISTGVTARRLLLSPKHSEQLSLEGHLPSAQLQQEQQIHQPFAKLNYSWAYQNPAADRPHKSLTSHKDPDALLYTHMGMLDVLPTGQIAAVWQGSTQYWEGGSKQSLYWAVSEDGGASWGKPQVVVPPAAGGLPVWGPVLHVEDGRVWLFYAASKSQCGQWGEAGQGYSPGGDILRIISDDNGSTWSQPEVVWAFSEEGGIPKVVANKLAVAHNGNWVLPFWHEAVSEACGSKLDVNQAAGVLVSSDKGMTWSMARIKALGNSWLIEASITAVTSPEEPPALLQMFRTGLGSIFQSWSVDGGLTWSAPIPSDLPNPNSKVHVTRLPTGKLLLAYNNDSDTGVRSPLTLASSKDGGQTWQPAAIIEDDPAGSFSYPTIQYVPASNRVLVIYSVAYQEAAPAQAQDDLYAEDGHPGGAKVGASRQPGVPRLPEAQDRKGAGAGGGAAEGVGAWGWTAYGMKVASLDAAPFL